MLFAADGNGVVWLSDAGGEPLGTLGAGEVSWGNWLVVDQSVTLVTNRATAYRWSLSGLAEEPTVFRFGDGEAVKVEFAPKSGRALVGTKDGALLITDLADGHVVERIVAGNVAVACDISPDGHWLAVAQASGKTPTMDAPEYGGNVFLWDVDAKREHVKLVGLRDLVNDFEFTADSRHVYTGSGVRLKILNDANRRFEERPSPEIVVCRWEVSTGRRLDTMSGFLDPINVIKLSPNGELIAVATGRNVSLRETSTGAEIALLKGHGEDVRCMAFSPDGRALATGSLDKTVRLWEIPEGK